MNDLLAFAAATDMLFSLAFIVLMTIGIVGMTRRILYWIVVHIRAAFIKDEGKRRVFLAIRLEE